MNWELLLYAAVTLALIAGVLFFAGFVYLVIFAFQSMREGRKVNEKITVTDWPREKNAQRLGNSSTGTNESRWKR